MSSSSKPRKVVRGPKGSFTSNKQLTDDGERLYERVAEEILRRHRKLYDTLTPYEQKLAQTYLADSIAEGDADTALRQALWDIDYEIIPPTIEQMVNDPDIFGQSFERLAPQWKRDVQEVLRRGSPYSEWIISASLGGGKTTAASIALACRLIQILCLKNPADFFGFDPAMSSLLFMVYAPEKGKAIDLGFSRVRHLVDNTRWFQRYQPRSATLSVVEWKKKRVKLRPGRGEGDALGDNLHSLMLDEADFFKNPKTSDDEKDKARQLYESSFSRVTSRFVGESTISPLFILVSSKRTDTAFLSKRLREAKTRSDVYVSDYKWWEVRTDKKFVLPKFSVEVGSAHTISRILGSKDTPAPHAQVVRDVPGELRPVFEQDVEQALRDFGNIAPRPVSTFMTDPQVIPLSYAQIKHPFKKEFLDTISIKTTDRIDQFFELRTACRIVDSQWMPRMSPQAKRFIHVDLGLTRDSCGIAMVHRAGRKRVDRFKPDGTTSIERHLVIVVDFVLAIRPPKGSEVDISKVRGFITYLSRLYRIGGVSFDKFESRESMQELTKLGITAAQVSVDRDDEAYEILRSAYMERRIVTYPYPILEKELTHLQHDRERGKVDHPKEFSDGSRGGKDCADGLAGAVFGCVLYEGEDKDAMEVPDMIAETPLRALPVSRNGRETTVVHEPILVPEHAASIAGIPWGDLEREAQR